MIFEILWDFRILWHFLGGFLGFLKYFFFIYFFFLNVVGFCFYGFLTKSPRILLKVTKVTIEKPKLAKNGPKQHKRVLFCQKGKKKHWLLEVGPRSGLYLQVTIKFVKVQLFKSKIYFDRSFDILADNNYLSLLGK